MVGGKLCGIFDLVRYWCLMGFNRGKDYMNIVNIGGGRLNKGEVWGG
jgi:hypothetical protein